MTKQEEIREGIKEIIRQAYIDGYNSRANGQVWEQEDGSVNLPEQGILIKAIILEQKLHSQGVVIKVDRELSIPEWDEVKDTALEIDSETWGKMLAILVIIIVKNREAGYVAVEPLVKEVKRD